MTGGHGQWFVQNFGESGEELGPMAALEPAEAAASTGAHLVAGTQAQALVAARGWGEALLLYPDARFVTSLPRHALAPDALPIYGRAPDAKLPA